MSLNRLSLKRVLELLPWIILFSLAPGPEKFSYISSPTVQYLPDNLTEISILCLGFTPFGHDLEIVSQQNDEQSLGSPIIFPFLQVSLSCAMFCTKTENSCLIYFVQFYICSWWKGYDASYSVLAKVESQAKKYLLKNLFFWDHKIF